MDDELSRLFDTPQKLTVDSVRLLLGSGASPNQCSSRNRYMLYLVAQHGNAAVAAVLLAYSAECDSRQHRHYASPPKPRPQADGASDEGDRTANCLS